MREIDGIDFPSLYSEHASSQRRHPTQRLGSAAIMPCALATYTCRGVASAVELLPHPARWNVATASPATPVYCRNSLRVTIFRMNSATPSGTLISPGFTEPILFMSAISILLFESELVTRYLTLRRSAATCPGGSGGMRSWCSQPFADGILGRTAGSFAPPRNDRKPSSARGHPATHRSGGAV